MERDAVSDHPRAHYVAMPYGRGMLQIDFDFIGHMLRIETSGGSRRSVPLTPITVAEFTSG